MSADAYVHAVEFALRDLPWRQRRDLVAELRTHLDEFPPDANLVDLLGTPERYAADMRAAAGLERRRGPIAWLRARRPRNVVLVVLSVVVLSLAIGGLVWIARYQPLAAGGVGYSPNAIDSPTGDGIYYVVRHGRRFRYGMTISNSGRYTVRVLAVPIEYELPFRYRLLMTGTTTVNYGGLPEPWKPFRPFDLAPGDERGIIFDGRFNEPCFQDSDWTQGWTSIPIRYQFLWRTATTEVPFNQQVAFVFRKDASRRCRASKGRG